jgi:hypothetical protein
MTPSLIANRSLICSACNDKYSSGQHSSYNKRANFHGFAVGAIGELHLLALREWDEIRYYWRCRCELRRSAAKLYAFSDPPRVEAQVETSFLSLLFPYAVECIQLLIRRV